MDEQINKLEYQANNLLFRYNREDAVLRLTAREVLNLVNYIRDLQSKLDKS